MCDQTTTGIHHGDVVGDFQFDRLALACRNDAPGILQGYRDDLPLAHDVGVSVLCIRATADTPN